MRVARTFHAIRARSGSSSTSAASATSSAARQVRVTCRAFPPVRTPDFLDRFLAGGLGGGPFGIASSTELLVLATSGGNLTLPGREDEGSAPIPLSSGASTLSLDFGISGSGALDWGEGFLDNLVRLVFLGDIAVRLGAPW